MRKWVYRKADGEFEQGGGFEPNINIPDPAKPGNTMPDPARGIAELTRDPDPRKEKYNEAGGQIEAKSQAEVDAFDDAALDAEFEGDPRVMAVLEAIAEAIPKPVGDIIAAARVKYRSRRGSSK